MVEMLTCVMCGRQFATEDTGFCSNTCEVEVITSARGGQPSNIEFFRYETGELSSAELAIFFGCIISCGLHEKLQPRYSVAARAYLDNGIITEDGTVDLDRHRELKENR